MSAKLRQLRRATSFGTTRRARPGRGVCSKVNWYWVRATRSSMVRSRTGRVHVQLDLGQVVEFGLQALDHLAGETSRSLCGLRLISRRPCWRSLLLSTPM